MRALDSRLSVPITLDWMSRLVANHPQTWIALGNAETKLLVMDERPIEKPVYICGLARAGSTILLETLSKQPNIATHRYEDFPFLFTPYWWNLLLKCMPWRGRKKRERAHGDGIFINPQSPEAMEEILWMAFFPELHKGQPEMLSTRSAAFDTFYRQHIQKLLLIRKAKRYLAKGNYNITRMGYLASLFPDARFIVPVRDPASHIVSLMRQHERFMAAGRKNPRVVRHMSAAGHFEFGLNRIPIHTGDEQRYREITQAWSHGKEVRGWALYWDAMHRFICQQLESNPQLKKQTLIVRYEDLCAKPQETLRAIFSHANFPVDEKTIGTYATPLRAPDYYSSPLGKADMDLIRDITGETAKLLTSGGAS